MQWLLSYSWSDYNCPSIRMFRPSHQIFKLISLTIFEHFFTLFSISWIVSGGKSESSFQDAIEEEIRMCVLWHQKRGLGQWRWIGWERFQRRTLPVAFREFNSNQRISWSLKMIEPLYKIICFPYFLTTQPTRLCHEGGRRKQRRNVCVLWMFPYD